MTSDSSVQLDAISRSSTEGLVERLREPDWHDPACPFQDRCYCGDDSELPPHDRVRDPLRLEAASTIEALTAERDEARSEGYEAGTAAQADYVKDARAYQRIAEKRADAAEAARDQALAQVGRLRQALERVREKASFGQRGQFRAIVEIAATALADLTLTPGIRNEDR